MGISLSISEVKSCECRLRVQTKGGDLRKGGASDARYAIVLDRPEARGEAAAAIAAASDIFRDLGSFKVAQNHCNGLGYR